MKKQKCVDLSVLFPMRTCPVCGREFLKRRDWGCVVESRQTGMKATRAVTVLCSIPCMKEYDRRQLERNARHADTLRCVQAYRLRFHDHLESGEIMRRLGHPRIEYVSRDCEFALNMYWQEIEWLEHNVWEAAAG